jgi:hypothetical protein
MCVECKARKSIVIRHVDIKPDSEGQGHRTRASRAPELVSTSDTKTASIKILYEVTPPCNLLYRRINCAHKSRSSGLHGHQESDCANIAVIYIVPQRLLVTVKSKIQLGL